MTLKHAKTIKPYETHFRGYDFTVPVGSLVSNNTAQGTNDNSRFWEDFEETIPEHTMLYHDLTYYGLNIPAEYCEPYNQ